MAEYSHLFCGNKLTQETMNLLIIKMTLNVTLSCMLVEGSDCLVPNLHNHLQLFICMDLNKLVMH